MTDVKPLLERLDLERLDRDLFRGFSPDDGRPRVFGGQVAAQALVAAVRTIEDPDRAVHSLHSYFLRPGDPKVPIIYEVDRIRDGRSFTTRRVVAIQNGEAIFNMAASLHKDEPGPDHEVQAPDVPPPESVPSMDELLRRAFEKTGQPIFQFLERLENPILIHDLDPFNPLDPKPRKGPHAMWWRSRGALPGDRLLHQCVLTYASDFSLADAALNYHGETWLDPEMLVASIDHAVWFHRPFRADEWMLYVTESPSAQGARGMNFGRIYTREGTLAASVAQECLMRRRG
jgi:acyl-CoA thioesterase-2